MEEWGVARIPLLAEASQSRGIRTNETSFESPTGVG